MWSSWETLEWLELCTTQITTDLDEKVRPKRGKRSERGEAALFAGYHRGTLLGSSRTPSQFKLFLQTASTNVDYVAV